MGDFKTFSLGFHTVSAESHETYIPHGSGERGPSWEMPVEAACESAHVVVPGNVGISVPHGPASSWEKDAT